MMREPSLHINKSELVKILKQLLPIGVDLEGFANSMLKLARPYSISTRSLTIGTDRLEKKAIKLVKSTTNDAVLFAKLIYYTRIKLKHRGITQIKPGGKNWEMVKEITGNAVEFNTYFNLPRRDGFLTYIQLALKKMGKFSLNRFPSLHESICNTFEAEKELLKDETPNDTRDMYNLYYAIILQNTGMEDNSISNPDKYVWFVRAKYQAKDMGITNSTYMKAQFDGLDFVRGIPHPTQMVGEKARERVIRYAFKHNINVKKELNKDRKPWLDINKIFGNEDTCDTNEI